MTLNFNGALRFVQFFSIMAALLALVYGLCALPMSLIGIRKAEQSKMNISNH